MTTLRELFNNVKISIPEMERQRIESCSGKLIPVTLIVDGEEVDRCLPENQETASIKTGVFRRVSCCDPWCRNWRPAVAIKIRDIVKQDLLWGKNNASPF